MRENLRMGLGTLREHKMRSGLAVLGIIVAVTTLISVVAILAGFDRNIQQGIQSFGTNTAFFYHVPTGPDAADRRRRHVLGCRGHVRYGYDDIEERFGVIPERMADFLALMGDAVDNIPGVPGVGRKTAATLLKHYDTLPGVFDNLESIPKLKFRGAALVAESLREHRDEAFLSRRLTGIACDMPLAAELEDLGRQAPDLAAVEAFYHALGFGRMLREQARRVAEKRRV